jgi:hypothetical protein
LLTIVHNTVFYFVDDPNTIEEHLRKENFESQAFFLEDEHVARDHIERAHGGKGRVEMRSSTNPDYLTTKTDCFPYL